MGVGPVRAALMRHLEQRSRKKQGAASTNKTKQDGNAPARRSIEAWLRKQARRPNDVAALARAYRDDVLYAYRRTHNNELPTGFVTWKQYWSVGTSKGTRDRNIARRVRDIIYDLDEAAATNLPSR
ncbi:MAG TPA: hypothetical protein VMF13_20015 [Luteitalea sp.]|nr:hypothetical protein [Luteitalea sp.]